MLAAVVAASLVVPLAPVAAVEELGTTRERFASAADRLDAAIERLERAERDIDAAEARLRQVSAEMARVEVELADASERWDIATHEADTAAFVVEAAEAEVAEATAREAVAVERLGQRVAEVYKRGSTLPEQILVQSIASTDDWHDVTVSLRIYARSVAEDRDLVEDAIVAIEAADAARARAQAARDAADQAVAAASEELSELVALRAEQVELVAQAEAERDTLDAIYAELEADAEVAQLVASRLADQVAQLERGAAERAEEERRAQEAAEREAQEEAERLAAEERRAEEDEEARSVDTDGDVAEPEQPAPPTSAAPSDGAGHAAGDAGDAPPSPTPSPPPAPSPPPPPPPATGAWTSRLPAAGQAWAGPITTAANANAVDPPMLAALVWTESGFNPAAVSWAGAIGLAQLMPGTAVSLGVDPWVPEQNLDGGARYLRMMYDRFGRWDHALAAYNAGPTRVDAAGPGIPDILETQLYVVRVLDRYALLVG